MLAGLVARFAATILEAGCGSGQDALYLATRGHKVTALDIHEIALVRLDEAKRDYEAKRAVELALETHRADILEPNLPVASFDLVFNSGVAEHLSPALRASTIASMASLVRPGGFVAVAVPNAWHPLTPMWEWMIERGTDHGTFDLDEQPVSLDDLAADIAASGCVIVDRRAIDPWRTLDLYPSWLPLRAAARLGERLNWMPASARDVLGTRLVVVGRKV